ncbi:MATE family efflux transporter [Oceanisphaera marina]|uniref:MATE family efflux transporter n=2 Tax=Oceanisphaera marina TaxID=2017550 RepID=A0ABQ1IW50_9GAMM|nr:MATE family efflux transporter [Oceanisphaera marina]
MVSQNLLLTAPIGRQLTKMAGPMALGIVAIQAFNLVDIFFIGLLGTEALAAISFTFPVTFVVISLAMGLGAGLSACLGQALGAGNQQQAALFTSHSLLLALLLVCLLSVLGMLSIDPLFRLLGATEALLVLLHDYMLIWYLTMPLLVLPMVGNSAIRATGDTRTPSVVMTVAGLVNGLLDPLLIFGLGPFPELGIKGAAMASACSWLMASVVGIWLLWRRERLLRWPLLQPGLLFIHWRKLLQVAIPASFTNLLNPLSTAVLMMILAGLGTEVVAAYGAASRIEALMLIAMMALSSVLAPFISQNTGAGQHQRSRRALLQSMRFAVGFQLGVFALLWVLAPWLADAFTDSQEVSRHLTFYLRLVPLGYGLQGCSMLLASALNGLRVSSISLLLNSIRLFGLLLPLAWLGSYWYGETGVFTGILIANILAGIIAATFAWWRFPWKIKQPIN